MIFGRVYAYVKIIYTVNYLWDSSGISSSALLLGNIQCIVFVWQTRWKRHRHKNKIKYKGRKYNEIAESVNSLQSCVGYPTNNILQSSICYVFWWELVAPIEWIVYTRLSHSICGQFWFECHWWAKPGKKITKHCSSHIPSIDLFIWPMH